MIHSGTLRAPSGKSTLEAAAFPFFKKWRRGKSWEKPRYLSDEDPVLLHEVVVVVTPCQQLPHLSPQRLRDAAPHQRRQRLGPHAQVQVPAEGGLR